MGYMGGGDVLSVGLTGAYETVKINHSKIRLLIYSEEGWTALQEDVRSKIRQRQITM